MGLWPDRLIRVIVLTRCGVEQISVMSLSNAYSTADAAVREQMELIRIVVASARNWAHYIGLLLSGASIFRMYATLYRLRLVPRLLSTFGLAATVSQLAGVSMPLFGVKLEFLILAPLALSQIALGIWLVARGFSSDELIAD